MYCRSGISAPAAEKDRAMKKKISIIIAGAMLAASMPAYAYSQSDYHAKANELKALIDECKELGINTQYEEIDANIIDVYADRIADFQSGGLSSTITSYQLSDLDTLYTNAKANLNAYKNGTKKAPAWAYGYEAGDVYRINGASLKNKYGIPYFSGGFGHFSMSGKVAELRSYGYDNIQTVSALDNVISSDRAVDCWNTDISGNAAVTFTPVTTEGRSNNTSLHVVNNSEYASGVYGRVSQNFPVKPNTDYVLSFYIKGSSPKANACYYQVTDSRMGVGSVTADSWKKVELTFTTGDNEYIKRVQFIFEKVCDFYLDDISITMSGKDKNVVQNGGFDGDGTDDFDIFYGTGTSLQETLKTLDAAEKNNAHVEVLLQLQQNMPACITNKYPEIGTSGRYNIDHAVAQQVEEAYIEGVINAISDYTSLGSIIVANEPDYNSSDFSYNYGTKFANYLSSKYGSVSALKTAYGNNSYSSFSSVGCPTDFEVSARFYDWKAFNDGLFTAWYSRTVNKIKECMPGIPVSIKIQPDFTPYDYNYGNDSRDQMAMGIDAEALGALSDYHGNDSYGYYEEGGTLRNAMKWYDYLGSIADKPIYDSEKHITKDAVTNNYNIITKFAKNAVWISMLHGLDMYSIWTWNTSVSDTSSSRFGHLAFRPSALAEVAHAALDANRLAGKVTAIANSAPSAAILRDDASRIFNSRHMHAIHVAYNAATEAGHKVGFVTPSNIASELSDYNVLIIPYATNVEPNVIDAINNYSGKIVMIGNDSLGKDQYNKSYSGSTLTKVTNIRNRSVKFATTNYSSTGDYRITAPTKDTLKTELVKGRDMTLTYSGALQDNIEWQYVPYQNGYLVSINNFDTSSSKTVSPRMNNAAFTHITSLTDMQNPVTNITLGAMTGGLYYVRNVDDEITDSEYGDIIVDPGDPAPESNAITTLNASRSGRVNTLEWDSTEDGAYNIYSAGADGSLTLITATRQKTFEEMSDGVKTYCVKCITANGENDGKYITCGADLNSLIDTESECNSGRSDFSYSFTNNNSYSVAYTVTVTSYNEDGSFNGAAVMEQLVPAGKSASFDKFFETTGTGTLAVTIK